MQSSNTEGTRSFGICTAGNEATLHGVDAHIGRRLRAIQLKHWKRKLTIALHLTKLGASKDNAFGCTYGGHKSIWAMSLTPAVHKALSNASFAERGLLSLAEQWGKSVQPVVASA